MLHRKTTIPSLPTVSPFQGFRHPKRKHPHSTSPSWQSHPGVRPKLAAIFLLLIVVITWRIFWLVLPEPDYSFDLPTDQLPRGEADSLVHIPLENVQEGTIPLVVKDRLAREGRTDKQLRLLGNRALIQYGDRLRNLMMFGGHMLRFDAAERHDESTAQATLFRQRLKDLAPWLKGDNKQPGWPMNQFPSVVDATSQAIVVCAGDKQFDYLEALLHTIRLLHRSTIPVHVTYRGDPDLSPKSRAQLLEQHSENSGRLEFIDLTQHFDVEAAKLQGWNLRLFGLLLVPEAQVALLDVDVLLLRPPEDLFGPLEEAGAHFFRDRVAPDLLWSPRQLLLRLQPHPSATARQALTNGRTDFYFTEHVQESGVVLIDKTRRYRGLWAACLLLGRWDVRRFAQRDLVYGDKELYWAAFETVNEPYTFARYYPGVVGGVVTDFEGNDESVALTAVKKFAQEEGSERKNNPDTINEALCGRLLHFDEAGLPLWSNGGYLTKEDDRDSHTTVSQKGLKPVLFVDGGDSQAPEHGNQQWKYHEGMGVTCLYPNSRGFRAVPVEQSNKATGAVNHYLQRMAFNSASSS